MLTWHAATGIDMLKEKLDLVLHDIELNPEGPIAAY